MLCSILKQHFTFLTVCQDVHMNCGYWASRNYCTQGPYTRYMRESCRKSCRICSSTGTGNSNSTNQQRLLKLNERACVIFVYSLRGYG